MSLLHDLDDVYLDVPHARTLFSGNFSRWDASSLLSRKLVWNCIAQRYHKNLVRYFSKAVSFSFKFYLWIYGLLASAGTPAADV